MSTPLGFCSNLLPAESLDAVIAQVVPFAAQVRERLGWRDLGLDLRLGSLAIADARATGWDGLRRALDQARLSAHTLNGFPLRPFHAARVKEQAYLPDWSEPERLDDTIALLQAVLALSDAPRLTISTVPGTFRPFGHPRTAVDTIARHLGRWAAAAAIIERDHGRRVVLALEPEPWCLLETTHDAVAFWSGPLADAGVAAATAALSGDAAAGRTAIAHHLGLCLDTCHLSLAFEDQREAVAALHAAQVPIAKCQITSAPEVLDPATNADGVRALHAMAEPRFLHQTAARSASGSLSRVLDLDQLPTCLARLPHASAIRSHFHVPVDRTELAPGLTTTAAETWAGTDAARHAGCPHFSVETYTWPILADQPPDVLNGTVRELATAAERMERG